MNNPKLMVAMAEVFSQLGVLGHSDKQSQEAVVRCFSVTHRTLQQCFMRIVIIPILVHLAEAYEAGRCDGRNMESGRLATRMLKDLNDDDLYLPFV